MDLGEVSRAVRGASARGGPGAAGPAQHAASAAEQAAERRPMPRAAVLDHRRCRPTRRPGSSATRSWRCCSTPSAVGDELLATRDRQAGSATARSPSCATASRRRSARSTPSCVARPGHRPRCRSRSSALVTQLARRPHPASAASRARGVLPRRGRVRSSTATCCGRSPSCSGALQRLDRARPATFAALQRASSSSRPSAGRCATTDAESAAEPSRRRSIACKVADR